jgi:hypothetical protein
MGMVTVMVIGRKVMMVMAVVLIDDEDDDDNGDGDGNVDDVDDVGVGAPSFCALTAANKCVNK